MPKKITFEIRKAVNGEFYWRAVHSNGNIIATAGETYKRKGFVTQSLGRFMKAIIGSELVIVDQTKDLPSSNG